MINLQVLKDQIRHCGCRLTTQRAIILQALCELDGHASVEQVHGQVTRHQTNIDLSTVYRTLEKLRDLHIVSQTDLGRGCAEYEIVTGQPHHHLVCQVCGRATDLDHSYLAPVGEAIRRDFGFDPVLSHFAIFGICRTCRDRETEQSA